MIKLHCGWWCYMVNIKTAKGIPGEGMVWWEQQVFVYCIWTGGEQEGKPEPRGNFLFSRSIKITDNRVLTFRYNGNKVWLFGRHTVRKEEYLAMDWCVS